MNNSKSAHPSAGYFQNRIMVEKISLRPSPNNPGLGNLSKLPLEIRLEIWDYFSLDICYDDQITISVYGWPNSALDLIRTSRTIFNEASDFLYRKTILSFSSRARPREDSWLLMSTNSGYTRKFSSLKDALRNGYGRLPLSKFKEIHIDIESPDTWDSETLLVIGLQNVHIAHLLALGEHEFAHISFELVSYRDYDWKPVPSQEGRASNILERNDFCHSERRTSIPRPDFEAVLTPFKRLRQFEYAQILYPVCLEVGKHFLQKFSELLTRDASFGADCDLKNDALSDENIEQDCYHLFEYMCIAVRRYDFWMAKQIHEMFCSRPPTVSHWRELDHYAWDKCVYKESGKG